MFVDRRQTKKTLFKTSSAAEVGRFSASLASKVDIQFSSFSLYNENNNNPEVVTGINDT